MTPALMTVDDAAVYLGTSVRHLKRLRDERRMPFVKLGPGRMAPVRFKVADLDAWIEQHTVAAEAS